ncbi:MAG: hypothetical protein EPO28_00255 [Saprospiraceae bacterium]|nr:MAG: hypothetical protein EPO28_00255 [Saprospiraceae bacterium]
MKKFLICACTLLAYGMTIGQNLVPNFSFEEHKTCDFIWGAIDTNFISPPVMQGWSSGTLGGTPDYFNECQLPPLFSGDNVSVPVNKYGYQSPFEGSAYGGIEPYARFSPTVEAREYLQTRLEDKLIMGKSYCIGFYTSFANQDSAVKANNASLVAPTTWGLFLSSTRPFNGTVPSSTSPPTTFYLSGTPQITTTTAITDTANWVLVADTYTAAGGEEWLTIGNFNPIGQTVLDTFYNAHDYAVLSYYYIDNVFVIPMDDGGLLPGDTALCAASFPLQLKAFEGFSNYSWSNGATTAATTAPGPGSYAVEADYAGCKIRDTITIAALPAPVLDLAPVHYCEDALPVTYTVPGQPGFDQFSWPDGTTGPTVTIRQAGALLVSASGICGSDTAALVVETDPVLVVDLGGDHTLCREGQLQAELLHSSTLLPNYTWSTGETTSEIYVETPGQYSLRSGNACGASQDEVVLSGCEPKVYVPNVFYPGSLHAENYLFRPFAVNAGIVSLDVFNRWGGKVYSGKGDGAAWDGTQDGSQCQQGVYAYLVRYKGEDGKAGIVHGDVLLLR